jgi:hypothetical protein
VPFDDESDHSVTRLLATPPSAAMTATTMATFPAFVMVEKF